MSSILDVLSGPDKWAKGYYAYDSAGNPREGMEHDACKWCISGAIRLTHSEDRLEMVRKLAQAIYKLFPERAASCVVERETIDSIIASGGLVPRFNDHLDTTFEDIVAVVKEAGL